MFKRHGFRASARQLFEDTSCPNCLREYQTRAKVLAFFDMRTSVDRASWADV